MRKIVLFMHTSLDGLVAGPKGEIDWIIVNEAMFDLTARLTEEADIALYGRVTFQLMESYWPSAGNKPNATRHDIQHSAWYNKVSKIILSKTLEKEKLSNTIIISDNIIEEITRIKHQTGKDILIFGSPSASHSLMSDNLIDDYWLLINPIFLGQGIPLFKELKNKTKLKLIYSNIFPSGVVCLHYQIDHDR